MGKVTFPLMVDKISYLLSVMNYEFCYFAWNPSIQINCVFYDLRLKPGLFT